MKEKRNTITDAQKACEETGINLKFPLMLSLLPLSATFVAILQGIICQEAVILVAKTGVVTLILTGAVTFYIHIYAEEVLKKRYAGAIIVLGYLVSIGLLLFVPEPGVLNFWMLGGLVIAMLLDNKLGLLFNFNLVFILGILMVVHLQTMIQILIICILLSLLAGALKEKTTFFYAVIIILSVNVTLACAINNFAFEKITDYNYLYSLLSIFAVLVVAFGVSFIYNKSNQPELGAAGEAAPQTDTSYYIKEEDISLSKGEQDLTARTSYEILCDKDNLLLKKLKEFSEGLYEHALKIGGLSSRAAREIGADELLAEAGGLYHEIGRINGKNYIEEGIKLAGEYAFPRELTAILREHNIKYEKPSSVEAAIVMLSDNVVSTLEYIEKTEDHKFTSDKIIENIFQMRLNKGTFDCAGISLKDYKILKEFYQAEFSGAGKE